jgi:hypothetical protein
VVYQPGETFTVRVRTGSLVVGCVMMAYKLRYI